jgi:hypothetical protein
LNAFTTCRAIDERSDGSDLHKNAVIFCTMAGQLGFRPPVESDFLDTGNRRLMLENIDQREIPIQHLKGNGPILADANATLLETWQRGAARQHWHVLREQFALPFWLLY